MGKIIYTCNHDYFKTKSLQSAYWAGFIAADGNISKNMLTLALAIKDEIQLTTFRDHTKSTNLIKNNNKGEFLIKRYQCTSKTIVSDLKELYNITERKSLTLEPPINLTSEQIDAFIIGYIDGDGSICMSQCRNSPFLIISILGTYNILDFIKSRFEKIIEKPIKANVLVKPNTNIYRFSINSNNARKLFSHYYNLPIYKLDRKWTNEIYNYSLNHKSRRHLK